MRLFSMYPILAAEIGQNLLNGPLDGCNYPIRSRIVDFADCRRAVDNAAGGGQNGMTDCRFIVGDSLMLLVGGSTDFPL